MKRFPLFTGIALGGTAFFFSACSKPADDAEAAKADVAETEAVEEQVAAPELVVPIPEEVLPTETAELVIESTEARVSYGLGYNIGRTFNQQGVTLDLAAVAAGIEDAQEQKETRIDQSLIAAAFQEMEQKAQAAQAAAGAAAAAEGKTWLAANAQKPGVMTTESGLQYEVIEEGDGPSPAASDTVEVHYHGTLIDGTVFDSSVQRGETIEFPVTGVIQGWVEALQLMQVGDKWRLFIPSELAYGPRGQGAILPHSALIFEVELISIPSQAEADAG